MPLRRTARSPARSHDLDGVARVELAAAPRRPRPAAGSRCPRAARARPRVDHQRARARASRTCSHSLKDAVARSRGGKRVPARALARRAPLERPRRASRCRSRSRCRPRSPSRRPPPSSASRQSPAARSCGRSRAPRAPRSRVDLGRRAAPRDRCAGRRCRGHRCRSSRISSSAPMQDRHLGGQEVVVAEGDLVGGGRVVLVDDRQHTPVQQLAQRLAGVQVVRAGAHVEERQQHLRARDAALAATARRRRR